jgi:Na+/H+-translocating membrane pyrophosphatase
MRKDICQWALRCALATMGMLATMATSLPWTHSVITGQLPVASLKCPSRMGRSARKPIGSIPSAAPLEALTKGYAIGSAALAAFAVLRVYGRGLTLTGHVFINL